MPDVVPSECFLGLSAQERFQQLYWAAGGQLTCFLGLDRRSQQEAFLDAVGADTCFDSEVGFWRNWADALGVECIAGDLEGVQLDVYTALYNEVEDDTMLRPECFLGSGPDGQWYALYAALLNSGGTEWPVGYYGLPRVDLWVENPEDLNAVTKTQGTITITNAYGSTYSDEERLVDDQYIDLRWAGNATLEADKKAYNMTTLTAPSGSNNDVPVLGMLPGRDWRLLANAFDLTDLKNFFTFNLGHSFELPWVPHGRHCEVYLNDVYQGTYYLAERVKRHVNRVNIGSAASGAFMCEIVADIQADPGETLFTTPLMNAPGDPRGLANDLLASFQVDFGNAATADAAVNALELDIVALDFASVWTQLDFNSAVDFFLLYEFVGNIDGVRFGSVRIARDNPAGIYSGRMFFVPWDFDFIGGIPFQYPGPNGFDGYREPDESRMKWNRWYSRLVQDPNFYPAVAARYAQLQAVYQQRVEDVTSVGNLMDETGARARNFAINGDVTCVGGTYMYTNGAEATEAMLDWIAQRKDILEGELTGGGTTALFDGIDTTTSGDWVGVYGADGYYIPSGASTFSPTFGGTAPTEFQWYDGTRLGSDGPPYGVGLNSRAVEYPADDTQGIAAYSYSPTLITVNCGDLGGTERGLSVYLLDWTNAGNDMIVTAKDNEGVTLATSGVVSNLNAAPAHVKFRVTGNVTLHVTPSAGVNAGVSAVFLNP